MDQLTMARVNVFALLRCLEELPAYDEEARRITQGKRETIQFTVGGVGKARLAIGRGRIEFIPTAGPCTILLWFPRAENLNAMFAGTGNPIPLKGLTRLGYLKGPFTRLTERLAHYLKATPELLQDPRSREANAALSLCAAVYAAAEIGNNDALGKLNAARMADGDVRIAAVGGPQLDMMIQGGRLQCRKGPVPRPRARMVFTDLDSAGAMLRGEMDSYAAIGAEKLVLGGFVPLLDNFNKILGLVPRYLRSEAVHETI
jgi:hypothetical protein